MDCGNRAVETSRAVDVSICLGDITHAKNYFADIRRAESGVAGTEGDGLAVV